MTREEKAKAKAEEMFTRLIKMSREELSDHEESLETELIQVQSMLRHYWLVFDD